MHFIAARNQTTSLYNLEMTHFHPYLLAISPEWHDVYRIVIHKVSLLVLDHHLIAKHQPEHQLDTCGLNCPLPLLKLKQTLNSAQPNERIYLTATDPHSEIDIGRFCARTGHTLASITDEANDRATPCNTSKVNSIQNDDVHTGDTQANDRQDKHTAFAKRETIYHFIITKQAT